MEKWKDIPGFEGKYQINLDGQVRSMDRLVIVKSKLGKERQQFVKGKIMSVSTDKKGYQVINLQGKGKQYTRLIHRLKYQTFVNPHILGKDIDHVDGNPSNNDLSNLRACNRNNNLTFKNVKRKNQYGYVGVKLKYKHTKKGERWASIVWNPYLKKNVLVYGFSSAEEAHEDYCKRRFDIYGDNFKEQE